MRPFNRKKIIVVIIIALISLSISCKKQSTPAPATSKGTHLSNPSTDSFSIDFNSTSLPGSHRWFGKFTTTASSSGSDSGSAMMLFSIVVVNGTTITDVYDTLKYDTTYKSADTMRFISEYNSDPITQHGYTFKTTIIYDISKRKITYDQVYDMGYMIYDYWEVVVHDTNITIPISTLESYTPSIGRSRLWTIHTTVYQGVFRPDTTVPFAVTVINDSTLASKSFFPYDELSNDLSASNNVILNYSSLNISTQNITFQSNYYPINGGILTYYYAKDSIVYDFKHEDESAPWYDYHLYTQ